MAIMAEPCFFIGDMKGDDMQSSEESGVCNTCYMFNHRPNSLNAGSLWGRTFLYSS